MFEMCFCVFATLIYLKSATAYRHFAETNDSRRNTIKKEIISSYLEEVLSLFLNDFCMKGIPKDHHVLQNITSGDM